MPFPAGGCPAKGVQWSVALAQRQGRWPAKRRWERANEGTDMDADLARLEQILPAQLAIAESSMHGYGLRAQQSFEPGRDIAVEHALIWAGFGKGKGQESFNALDMFPVDTPEVEAQQSAVTLMLAMLQRSSSQVELMQSWSRLCCKGPQTWRSLPATKQALERRLRRAREILESSSVDLQITDEELIALDLQRIGVGVGPATVVPLCFALLNHSCCPNAKLVYRGSNGFLICTRAIEAGEEIFISYINEVDEVFARRYHLLELHGVKCLCSRCAANFATSDCKVMNSWVCPCCKSPIEDQAVQCSGGTAVTCRDRQERRRREQAVWAALLQATSYAVKLASGRRDAMWDKVEKDRMTAALRCVSQAQWEFTALRPPGSQARVKAWAQLRSSMRAVRHNKEVTKFVRQIEMDFVKELAQRHWAISAESVGKDLSIGDARWARRLVAALRLYELTCDTLRLVRVGPRSDGGHVMMDSGQPIKHFLSYGVGTNIDFEWELAMLGTRVHLFDHKVDSLPRQHPNFSFHQEALCAEELPGVGSTLAGGVQLLGTGPSALKCDVEGEEFRAILATDSEVLGRFDQLCLGLHWLGRPRCGDAQMKAMALEKLNEQFVMLHAHGNSYADVVDVARCQIPDMLEVLYVHRRLLGTRFRPSTAGLIPSELDSNHCPFVPDIHLPGPPFGADVPD
ncbi:unnamed protein product [Effrenium voratum]|uniref:SET domain-containing protein n=1 Tax=Effrenium voratum TaxID=2562239 RepID=A0AA36JBG2_9DINO|nr:unnamed protein product [Effrenium voratum]CAJ1414443.1 unnamed protein product [Effrenium voratum]CAJ1455967.1 unnamed protein product [Effrenium voratum]